MSKGHAINASTVKCKLTEATARLATAEATIVTLQARIRSLVHDQADQVEEASALAIQRVKDQAEQDVEMAAIRIRAEAIRGDAARDRERLAARRVQAGKRRDAVRAERIAEAQRKVCTVCGKPAKRWRADEPRCHHHFHIPVKPRG